MLSDHGPSMPKNWAIDTVIKHSVSGFSRSKTHLPPLFGFKVMDICVVYFLLYFFVFTSYFCLYLSFTFTDFGLHGPYRVTYVSKVWSRYYGKFVNTWDSLCNLIGSCPCLYDTIQTWRAACLERVTTHALGMASDWSNRMQRFTVFS